MSGVLSLLGSGELPTSGWMGLDKHAVAPIADVIRRFAPKLADFYREVCYMFALCWLWVHTVALYSLIGVA